MHRELMNGRSCCKPTHYRMVYEAYPIISILKTIAAQMTCFTLMLSICHLVLFSVLISHPRYEPLSDVFGRGRLWELLSEILTFSACPCLFPRTGTTLGSSGRRSVFPLGSTYQKESQMVISTACFLSFGGYLLFCNLICMFQRNYFV